MSGDTLKPDWTIGKIYGDDRKLFVFWRDGDGVIIEAVEVLSPMDAGVATSASAQWAAAATRKLRAEKKIPKGTKKSGLARLLEAEAENAVKTGQIRRALRASYLENQLVAWGIWPLDFLRVSRSTTNML